MSTRAESNKQEKRIAKAIGGRQVIGSGSTPFLKGDVTTSNLFIEAKTKMEPSKSIKVNKEWLEKAKEQAYAMRKEDYTVAISFGDGKDFYIIEDNLLLDLYKSREALRAVLDRLEEKVERIGKQIIDPPADALDKVANETAESFISAYEDVSKMIKEVLV